MKRGLLPYLLILVGLVAIVGGIANLDKVMTHPNTRFFVDKFGRNGARVALVVLGVVLAAAGGVWASGVIHLGR